LCHFARALGRTKARDRRSHSSVHNRTLTALCISDLLLTSAFFLTTLPIPSNRQDVWCNHGSQATCVAQVFSRQLGRWTSSLWNLMLASVAVVMVRHRWTEDRLKQLEPWMQGCIWTTGLASAVFPIPMGLFNAGQIGLLRIPFVENRVFFYGSDDATCARGDNSSIYQVAFTVFPLGPCVIGSAVCFLII